MEGRRNKKGRRKTAMRHTSPTSHNKRQVSTLQDHEFMARAVRVDSAVQVLQKVLSQASEAINSISAPLTQMTTEKVQEISRLRGENYDLKAKLDALAKESEHNSNNKTHLVQTIEKLEKELSRVKDEYAAEQEQTKKLSMNCINLQRTLVATQQNFAKAESQLQQSEKRSQSLRAALRSAEERIVDLNFAEEKAQRKLSEGMRKVMQERQREAEAQEHQKQKTGAAIQQFVTFAKSMAAPGAPAVPPRQHTALSDIRLDGRPFASKEFENVEPRMWTPNMVCQWLVQIIELPIEYTRKVFQARMSGEKLLNATDEKLSSVGVTRALHRRKLLKNIERLKAGVRR